MQPTPLHQRPRGRQAPNGEKPIPTFSFPASLPITAKKEAIIEAIRKSQVVILTGETGSGKTTQIPKMCLAAGLGRRGLIGLTQPRRIAAVSIAQRIASELGQACGESVSYKIRFEEKTSPRSLIKVMTDGILLAETQADRRLSAYEMIIVDEAHERSLNIDFILGYLRTLLSRRKDLKVIITSATMDTAKFSQAFGDAPVIEVSGRMFPVEVRYAPIDPGQEEKGEITYVDAAVSSVEQLQRERRFDDILIFLPTERDIRETCERLTKRCSGLILPLYARLSAGAQKQVFAPADVQKIIVATNIAETSLTIPGIKYVIDAGLARILEYNPRSQTTGLPVKPISRSSAEQRKGRCGRVSNGICIRLYSPEDLADRPLYSPPEILRSNLSGVILRMLALHLGSPFSFPFIDRPQPKSIRDGIDILRDLGAIEPDQQDPDSNTYRLTPMGKAMAGYPLDPRISRMILEAQKEDCLSEMAVIAAALSISDPRERPFEKANLAAVAHAKFQHPDSDFLGFLQLWNEYAGSIESLASQSKLRKFCHDHFLSYRRMMEWRDIYSQILDIASGAPIGKKKKKAGRFEIDQTLADKISRCVLSGYLSNIAQKKEKNFYTAARGREVMLFPGSGLFNRGGAWIVASEIAQTSRLFARNCGNISPDWLEALGGDHCRHVYWGAHWEKKRGEVVVFEKVTLFGLTIVEKRSVAYDRINPDEAKHIFVREALVAGEIGRPVPFLEHNLALWEEAKALEDKLRTRGIVADEEAIATLYEERLPVISDIRSLLKLIKDRGGDAFLRLRQEDFLAREPDEAALTGHPDAVQIGSAALPCQYRFDPGRAEDGVTIELPVGLVSKAASENLEKQLPSLLQEKVLHLLKSLPKNFRSKLPPLIEVARVFCASEESREASVYTALSRFLQARYKITVALEFWSPEKLPLHLQVRYRVCDETGHEVKTSRDLDALQKDLSGQIQTSSLESYRQTWEKDNLTVWDFGDLPPSIEIKGPHGVTGYAYPALCVHDDTVNLRLFLSQAQADATHPQGVARLLALLFADKLKTLKKNIAFTGELKDLAACIGPPKVIELALLNRIQKDLFTHPFRDKDAFMRHTRSVETQILPYGQQALAGVKPIIRAFADTDLLLKNWMQKNRANKPVYQFLDDTRKELAALVPANFPERYSEERLREIPRYLKALAIRAERGSLNLAATQKRLKDVSIYCDILENLQDNTPSNASAEKRNKIEEFRWMIEEYKVSVFAQELKTPYRVSPKRLNALREEIDALVG